MTRISFLATMDALSRAGVPTRELHGGGHVAVTPAAGRVIALAFHKKGPNLLWSNPYLTDANLVRNHPEKLVGGIGGDRLWFAPELAYHWSGEPDWQTLGNYAVPTASDPGAYRFVDATEQLIALHGRGELRHRTTGVRVGFEVSRTIRMAPAPLSDNGPLLHGVDYAGIETEHLLKLDAATKCGQLDLWHLLQVPSGSMLIVPFKTGSPADTRPLLYTGSQVWLQKPDKLLRRYDGTAHAKFGVSVRALTGRTAVLQKLTAEIFCLLVRQFTIDPNSKYADHPYGNPRADQAFQAWDGLGFGEMEYHSPMLDAQSGPRELRESDQLWAFGGSQAAISAIAERLLGCDINDVFPLMA